MRRICDPTLSVIGRQTRPSQRNPSLEFSIWSVAFNRAMALIEPPSWHLGEPMWRKVLILIKLECGAIVASWRLPLPRSSISEHLSFANQAHHEPRPVISPLHLVECRGSLILLILAGIRSTTMGLHTNCSLAIPCRTLLASRRWSLPALDSQVEDGDRDPFVEPMSEKATSASRNFLTAVFRI